MLTSPETKIFCRQIRSRSQEHLQTMKLLATHQIAGQMVAVLRQELDSMVRVIYLLDKPVARRNQLIVASVNGERWYQENSPKKLVTDKEMVELAQTLEGWTQSVYKFGCAFIHLSACHDYSDRDPLQLISNEEKQDILYYCCYYHGGPISDTPSFQNLIPYFPDVLKKISSNLECNLKRLEGFK
jgi:hypothetical protein